MDAETVRKQLDRILGSGLFSSADRSSRFLRFVVERTLDGRTSELKESVIGVEVLGRNPSFDPKNDPIVRAEATRLRTRLDSYYQTEGKGDRIRIALPKGGYVPEFSASQTEKPAQSLARPILRVSAGAAAFGFAVATVLLIFHRPSNSPTSFRLSALPPTGTSIVSSVISPDGRRIAFTAISGGNKALWVRDLDSLDAKKLPDTDDASFPFWSPDGHSLGFFYRGEMKRIQTSGGPAQVIAAARVGFGGAWSPNDVIVFPPWPSGGLFQIPAGGGRSKPATVLDATREEFAHCHPSFLPDGRHFLFFAVSSRKGASAIRVGSLDSTDSRFLVNADGAGIYGSTQGERQGFLLFPFHGGLMAQPFDPQRLELSGSPVPLASDVAMLDGRGDFSVSTTGMLAYRTASPKDRQLAWFDREGRPLQTVGSRNSYYSWSLSPDETRVAMQEETTRGGAISTMEVAQQSPVLLTTSPQAGIFLPIWSPDSSEVIYAKDDVEERVGGEPAMSLHRQALNSATASTLLRSPGPKFTTDWSTGGRFVAYFTPWPGWQRTSIFIVDLKTPGPAPTALQFAAGPNSVATAQFSPERGGGAPRWVAYTSQEAERDEIYVGDFPAGNRKFRISPDGGWQPHWRADGLELFYATLDGVLMAVAVRPGDDFRHGPPRALFRMGIRPPLGPPNVPVIDYAPSRDGRRFMINEVVEDPASNTITILTPWRPQPSPSH